MSDPKNRERVDRIFDAIEASLEEMTGDELRDHVRALGADPAQVVTEVQNLFAATRKEHRQAKLREAQAGQRAAVQAYRARSARIPKDPAAQRAMIAYVMQHHPQQQVTMHHRDLEAMPDEELVEILKQFEALGLLTDEES